VLVIAERINGMFKEVGQAIADHDESVIQDLARRQVEAGAGALDINVGPTAEDVVGTMAWLVESARQVVDVPMCVDSAKPEAVRAGLEAAEGHAIINSTTAEPEKMDVLLPLAAEYNCSIIGLTLDANGVPRDADGRMEVALALVAACMEAGIPTDHLYIDPVILPVNALPQVPGEVLKALGMCHALADPPPQTVLGLSNISQGAVYRQILNRTFLVMAIAQGLDAAIMDAFDEEMLDAMITAELLLNQHVYCDDFLKAYRA